MALTHDGESPGYAGVAVELPPAKAGGLAQSGATTKVVNRTCLNAHKSTHEGQSHRLKPVVFTKCVDNKKLASPRRTPRTRRIFIHLGKLSSSHGLTGTRLTGTRASSPQADRMSALPVSILELAQNL